MTRYELMTAKLLQALDEKRQRYDWSWRRLGVESGVDHVVFHRMRQGKKPSSDVLLTLLVYLGADYLPVTRRTGWRQPEEETEQS